MAKAEGKDTTLYTCKKCGRSMQKKNFYLYKDGTCMDYCKKCLTMHIDPFDESTFLWILQDMDLPWVPLQWQSLRDKAYVKDPHRIGAGTAIFGRYVAAMKLAQYRSLGYADSAEACDIYCNRHNLVVEVDQDPEYEAEITDKFKAGEISEAQYRTLVSTKTQREDGFMDPEPEPPPFSARPPEMLEPIPPEIDPAASYFFNESQFLKEEDIPDPGADLTDEDKMYLVTKWGRLYKPSEWVQLEQTYNEMMESFDIQDSDTIETLKFICKVNLKMNQAIDSGDVDGFQKLSRTYDSLRKSAKFTAAQNKEQKNDFVDSVGELVAMCERQGFIPRYATDIPQDKVDATLKDMNDYIHKLVTQDLGFGNQIEDALKKIQYQKELDEAEAEKQKNESDYEELDDLDLTDYYEDIEEQKEQDKMTQNQEDDED